MGDIDSMATNSLKLLLDKKLLKQFKNNAFQRAQHFDIVNILPMYVDLYDKALSLSRKEAKNN